jgi:hypothetical protein
VLSEHNFKPNFSPDLERIPGAENRNSWVKGNRFGPGLAWGGFLESGFIVVFRKNHFFRLSLRSGFLCLKWFFSAPNECLFLVNQPRLDWSHYFADDVDDDNINNSMDC